MKYAKYSLRERESRSVRRLLPLLLAAMLTVSVLPVTAGAYPSEDGCPSGRHKWQVVGGTQATCGKSGTIEYLCGDCDKKVTETEPATGKHSWGEWTYSGDNQQSRRCSVCGATESRPTTVNVRPSTPAPAAQPTQAPAVTQAAAPAPQPPAITKHPKDVTVKEGENATLEAGYSNAIWAAWRFISPDGKTVVTYDKAEKEFPGLVVKDGEYSTMKLENVPYSLNGWRAACLYTNNVGSTQTQSALITVIPKEETAPATPEPTEEPTPTPEVTPTPEPTEAPTPEPTEAPTPEPTATPAPAGQGGSTATVLILSVTGLAAVLAICGTAIYITGRKRR